MSKGNAIAMTHGTKDQNNFNTLIMEWLNKMAYSRLLAQCHFLSSFLSPCDTYCQPETAK
jgi:hypothetical protein